MTQFKKMYDGFTLIEVAIVLLIVGILLAAVITPMGAQRESNKIKQAQRELKAIEEALYGFAIASDRLPCPTQPGLGGVSDGGGAANCNSYHGFVASTSLGLQGTVNCDGLLLDPWGNPYRYSITNSDADGDGRDDFAVTAEMGDVGVINLAPDLQVCSNTGVACNGGTPAADIVAASAVAVVFSMGSNWSNPSASENENAGEATVNSGCGLPAYDIGNDPFFYASIRIETGVTFNDIVSWISPNIVYSKMLAAGRL